MKTRVFSVARKYRSRGRIRSSPFTQKGCKNRDRGYSYLNEACRDAGAGRDDGLETAVVHHEVANCNKQRDTKNADFSVE